MNRNSLTVLTTTLTLSAPKQQQQTAATRRSSNFMWTKEIEKMEVCYVSLYGDSSVIDGAVREERAATRHGQ